MSLSPSALCSFSYSCLLFWGKLALFCPQTPGLSGWVLNNNSFWLQKEFVELKDCRIWLSIGLTSLQWVSCIQKKSLNVQCFILCSFQMKGWFLRFWPQLVLGAFFHLVSQNLIFWCRGRAFLTLWWPSNCTSKSVAPSLRDHAWKLAHSRVVLSPSPNSCSSYA